MKTLFLHLLNMSITATWIAIAVIVLRFILKKAPKWIILILWSFVALRLICPYSIESIFSLIPSTETVPQNIMISDPEINSGISFLNQTINPIINESLSPNITNNINPIQTLTFVLSAIWIIGIVVMALYTLIRCIFLYRKIRESILLKDNIYLCDLISTPSAIIHE